MTEQIRILRVHNRFVIGGPLTNVVELSRHLPPSYHTRLVGGRAEPMESDAIPYLESLGLELRVIDSMRRSPSLLNDIKALFELHRIIREYRPHIVHSHGAKPGFLARMLSRWMKVPVVVHTYHGHTFHDYFSKVGTWIYLILERWANTGTDAIIALSPSQKEELVKKHEVCDGKKVETIPLGFDVDSFARTREHNRSEARRIMGIGEEELLVGWVGRMVAVKDPFLFIDAVKQALQIGPPFHAAMVGDGPLKTISQSKARNLSLDSNIHFTSWLHPPQLAVAAFDILVLTSFNEGTPLVLMEAQASSIPVVSVDAGGAAESFLPGESGILVEGRDAGEIAGQLTALLADEPRRKEMGRRGAEFVKARFDRSRLTDDVDHLYMKLLRSKGLLSG